MNKSLLSYSITLVLLGFGLYLHLSPSFSSETDLQPERQLEWIIKNIKQREDSLKTFTAKFVQIKRTQLLQDPLRSEGLVYFDCTGKMLWKVTKPSPLVVLLKNDLLYVDYPDLSKTKRTHIGSSHNAFNKYFGIGQSIRQLKKLYEIQLVNRTHSDTFHLKLIPKKKAIAKRIDSIEVEVNSTNWLPERIHFKEVKGDYTSLSLRFTSINSGVPPGVFSLGCTEDHANDSQNTNTNRGGQR